MCKYLLFVLLLFLFFGMCVRTFLNRESLWCWINKIVQKTLKKILKGSIDFISTRWMPRPMAELSQPYTQHQLKQSTSMQNVSMTLTCFHGLWVWRGPSPGCSAWHLSADGPKEWKSPFSQGWKGSGTWAWWCNRGSGSAERSDWPEWGSDPRITRTTRGGEIPKENLRGSYWECWILRKQTDPPRWRLYHMWVTLTFRSPKPLLCIVRCHLSPILTPYSK